MNVERLREFTPARVAIGRVGHSLATRELLDFQLAHSRARDAVHARLDANALARELGGDATLVHSAAADRATYLRRPDLGRRLDDASRERLSTLRSDYDALFVLADGLSALAVHRHAAPLLAAVRAQLSDWRLAPVVIAEQARVAIGDDIGATLGAALTVVLIGERPGLSSPDSLGVYLTWNPCPGRTDAERNCISNIRPEGLSYDAAAHTLLFLMRESRNRKLSGIGLKEDSGPPAAIRDLQDTGRTT
jgi:ethanolamine ammonia-lyase small subunit